MALSRVIATGDGVTRNFAVNFALGYLSTSDVTCRVGTEVDGTGQPVYRSITWNSPNIATVNGPIPDAGVRVLFDRSVPRDRLLVNYEDGDIINDENLDTANKQTIMLVHELLDGRIDQINNDLNVGGFRITSLGAPINPTDAATRAYVDDRIALSASQAAAALASANAAATSASNASGSASAAAADRTQTGLDRTATNTSRVNAASSATLAQKWATEAEDVVVSAGQYSAYHWAQKAMDYAGGTVSISDVIGLEDALNSKFNVSGGTLTNDVRVAKTGVARVRLHSLDTSGKEWGFYSNIDGKVQIRNMTDEITVFEFLPDGTMNLIGMPNVKGAIDSKVPLSGGVMSGALQIQNLNPIIRFNSTQGHNYELISRVDGTFAIHDLTNSYDCMWILDGKAYFRSLGGELKNYIDVNDTRSIPKDITKTTQNDSDATGHTHKLGFLAAEVFTGTSRTTTDYPIGHTVVAITSGVNIDVNAQPPNGYIGMSDLNGSTRTFYKAGEISPTMLSGVWRSRGKCAETTIVGGGGSSSTVYWAYIFERVA